MASSINNSPSRSQRILAWLLALLFCILITAALAVFKVIQIKEAIAFGESFPEQSEMVESTLTRVSLWQPQSTTMGYVVTPNLLVLKTEVSGRITRIGFSAGAKVKKGQTLIQLDTSEERASFQAAKANLKLAELDLKRIQKLRRNNTASQEQLDQALAQRDSSAANVLSLEAVMAKKRINAPFNAQAGLHHLQLGQFLAAGSEVTTLVGLTDYTWVDFTQAVNAAPLPINTQVELALNGLSKRINATVIAADTRANAQSRAVKYRARVGLSGLDDAVRNQLIHNASVKVYTPKGDEKKAIMVEKTAIKRDVFGTYVFELIDAKTANNDGVKTPDHGYRAKRHKVILGAEQDAYIAVIEGLPEQMLIATKGAYKLHDGLLVYVTKPNDTAKGQ